MIKILLCLFLAIPSISHASFLEGMIVGSLLTPSKKTTVVEDEFALQSRAIESRLRENTYYTNYESLSFDVPKKNADSYFIYFQNKGYNVSLVDNTLVFDFKVQYQSFLARQAEIQKDHEDFVSKVNAFKTFCSTYWWVFLMVFMVVAVLRSVLFPTAADKLAFKLIDDYKGLVLRQLEKNRKRS